MSGRRPRADRLHQENWSGSAPVETTGCPFKKDSDLTQKFDWERVQATAPIRDELPGELAPYALSAGEGIRFDLGDWHLTTMARFADTGDEYELHRVTLPGGSACPFITTPGYSFLQVLEGELTIWFTEESHRIVAGDSAVVPAGTPFAITGDAAVNSFFWYSTDEWLHRLTSELGTQTASHIFNRTPQKRIGDLFASEVGAGVGITVADLEKVGTEPPARSGLPEGERAFVTKSGLGERHETFQQVNAFTARSRNTSGRFFTMDTRGAKTPYIPLHFHQEHSENFFCLSGKVKIHANGSEFILLPGDFLQAPAGTIHSFAHDANNTRMLGILNPPVFEKFFEYMNDPTEAVVQAEGGHPHFPAEGFQRAQAELDLVVVGPPPHTVG